MTSLLERKISSVPKYTVLQEDSPSSFEYFASCCTRSLIDWFPKCMGILCFFWCSWWLYRTWGYWEKEKAI